ncbi:hypothetical protein EB151_06910, partial [archaeon]|nr:hypothetical protein [archaeon]
NAVKDNPEIINFVNATSGTLSLVNPAINIIPNQIIKFDLSDSSLSFAKDSNLYSAFDFGIYYNSEFTDRFKKTEESSKFDVTKTGRIGIDSNCNVQLNTVNITGDLYYTLVPVDFVNNVDSKKQIIIDQENVEDNNKLILTSSSYSGSYNVSGVGQTTFTYNILSYPEALQYQESDGKFEYYTDSKNVTGEIREIDLRSGGSNYTSSPGISTIISSNGSGAIIEPLNSKIGKIKSVTIEDIGFNYPADTTLRPTAKLPQILSITHCLQI